MTDKIRVLLPESPYEIKTHNFLFENVRKTQVRIFQAIADGGEVGTTCELVQNIESDVIIEEEVLCMLD